MLRLLIDHNFDNRVIRRLRRRIPDLEVFHARAAGLADVPDDALLREALTRDLTVLTHDASTIPPILHDRLRSGEPTGRVIVVVTGADQSRVIDDLEITLLCSIQSDWERGAIWVPL